MQKRLVLWSKLTPEQRKAAREKYSAFSKVPPEKREQVKAMVTQPKPENQSPAVSAAPSAKASAHQ